MFVSHIFVICEKKRKKLMSSKDSNTAIPSKDEQGKTDLALYPD